MRRFTARSMIWMKARTPAETMRFRSLTHTHQLSSVPTLITGKSSVTSSDQDLHHAGHTYFSLFYFSRSFTALNIILWSTTTLFLLSNPQVLGLCWFKMLSIHLKQCQYKHFRWCRHVLSKLHVVISQTSLSWAIYSKNNQHGIKSLAQLHKDVFVQVVTCYLLLYTYC